MRRQRRRRKGEGESQEVREVRYTEGIGGRGRDRGEERKKKGDWR